MQRMAAIAAIVTVSMIGATASVFARDGRNDHCQNSAEQILDQDMNARLLEALTKRRAAIEQFVPEAPPAQSREETAKARRAALAFIDRQIAGVRRDIDANACSA